MKRKKYNLIPDEKITYFDNKIGIFQQQFSHLTIKEHVQNSILFLNSLKNLTNICNIYFCQNKECGKTLINGICKRCKRLDYHKQRYKNEKNKSIKF